MDEHKETTRRATAYHEAGHAVMRLTLGRSVTHATIRSD
jgi:ATP-dependent Zn protease